MVGLVGAVAALTSLPGCQVLGPTAMAAGRGAYTDVIARTNAEQLLAALVRLRYADPIGFLSVSSVTASLKFGANVGAEFGVGPESNYSGNLVPLSGGVSYEDNPTISYAPVSGQAFLRDWLSPLSIELLVLALQGGRPDPSLLPLLVAQMNDLRSPLDCDSVEAVGFRRANELLVQLALDGAAVWGGVPGSADHFQLVLSDRGGAHRARIEEVLRLLGVPMPSGASDAPIQVPITVGTRAPGQAVLAVRTHSIAQLLQLTAASIDVPAEHVADGITVASTRPPAGDVGGIVIRSSPDAPKHATVAVRHRGCWYFVDDTDLTSKRNFQRLETLFMMRMFDAEKGTQSAPVLTIPVG